MIVTVAATKGGVGKTTTAVEFAHELREMGRVVGLLDLDPQGTARRWLPDLAVPAPNPCVLREHVEQVAEAFEVLVIDTPPGASATALAAYEAADVLVAVTRPGPGDLDALAQLARVVEPDVVLVAQFDRRRTLHAQALELVQQRFANRVPMPVPSAASVERAQAAGEPLPVLSPPAIAYRDALRMVCAAMPTVAGRR